MVSLAQAATIRASNTRAVNRNEVFMLPPGGKLRALLVMGTNCQLLFDQWRPGRLPHIGILAQHKPLTDTSVSRYGCQLTLAGLTRSVSHHAAIGRKASRFIHCPVR